MVNEFCLYSFLNFKEFDCNFPNHARNDKIRKENNVRTHTYTIATRSDFFCTFCKQ